MSDNGLSRNAHEKQKKGQNRGNKAHNGLSRVAHEAHNGLSLDYGLLRVTIGQEHKNQWFSVQKQDFSKNMHLAAQIGQKPILEPKTTNFHKNRKNTKKWQKPRIVQLI